MKLVLYFLCFLSWGGVSYAKSIEIPIIGDEASIRGYLQLVNDNGGKPSSISDYSYLDVHRASVSLLLLIQALEASDLEFSVRYIYSPNIDRGLREVKEGRALLYIADIWENDFDENTAMTTAVLRRGEFEKSLYVHDSSSLTRSTFR